MGTPCIWKSWGPFFPSQRMNVILNFCNAICNLSVGSSTGVVILEVYREILGKNMIRIKNFDHMKRLQKCHYIHIGTQRFENVVNFQPHKQNYKRNQFKWRFSIKMIPNSKTKFLKECKFHVTKVCSIFFQWKKYHILSLTSSLKFRFYK